MERSKGRFRSFLLAAFQNFMANETRRLGVPLAWPVNEARDVRHSDAKGARGFLVINRRLAVDPAAQKALPAYVKRT